MRALADLHTHSDRSDGIHTPQELVELAEKQNLGGIALTDHDTLDGIQDFMEAPTTTDIRLYPCPSLVLGYTGAHCGLQ